MMQTLQLDVGDMIQIRTTSLELAKLVKLQPQSTNFLNISDPRAVLEKVFRNFAALTRGDVFNFEYNDETYEMAVLDVKPETEKMGVCMIETDVSVDFAPPVGYVEPEKQQRGSGTSTPRSTRGAGLPAGGLLHNQGTMAQAINFDAIAPGSARGGEQQLPRGREPVGGEEVEQQGADSQAGNARRGHFKQPQGSSCCGATAYQRTYAIAPPSQQAVLWLRDQAGQNCRRQGARGLGCSTTTLRRPGPNTQGRRRQEGY